MKYTNEDLKIMQSWSLERKIQVTQAKIIEFHRHFDGKVYVSFSGGKDSTVLVDLAKRIYPDIDILFIDTGLEYPEVRKFAMSYPNVTVIKPKMPFNKVIEKYGYPVVSKEQSQFICEFRNASDTSKVKEIRLNGNRWGRGKISEKWKYLIDAPFLISHKCCNVMKKDPAKEFEKKTGLYPIVATMACESALRKSQWISDGCNAFESKRPISKPMSFWTEQDVLKYVKLFHIPYASIYGDIIYQGGIYTTTGLNRTGCMFCCYGIQNDDRPNRFEKMK